MSGGGPFSGRMTAPMCIAGGLCKQWLEAKGIRIGAHIAWIDDIDDNRFDPVNPNLDIIDPHFPVLDPICGEQMQEVIAKAKKKGDSVGGIIECAITGLAAGIGNYMFEGVESHIASIVYSIPAVKGLDFGIGFASIYHTGSYCNDEFIVDGNRVITKTNHCGGILGGITNGMPILFRVAIKPTPSIGKPQKSVNLKTMEEVTIEIKGRHDPCIVPRAVPVVEAAAAIAIYDLILGEK
jgi:chorismate synthase